MADPEIPQSLLDAATAAQGQVPAQIIQTAMLVASSELAENPRCPLPNAIALVLQDAADGYPEVLPALTNLLDIRTANFNITV